MLKAILTFTFLTLFANSNCQIPLVLLPDTLGKNLVYYSPTHTAKVKAVYRGVLEIGQPFDSLQWTEHKSTEPLSTNQNKRLLNYQNKLLVIWDTLQEWDCLEFLTSPKGKEKYSPAKYVPVYKNDKEIYNRDVKIVKYKGMPIYILNNSDSNILIRFPKYGLFIFQEALDKTGKWRRIEEPFLMPKGYSRPITSRFIKPGQFIVTTVYKYKGSFSTQLRLCLENQKQLFYSEPFRGSINYSQFVD
jgi:hypothetical protein